MTKGLNREIWRIALPAIVTNVTIPLLGLLDTAIAGHLDASRGALYIGAVSVGAMMFNLLYWNFGFLRMGTSGLTAQAYGRRDTGMQAAILQRSTLLGLAIGVLIIALQWPLQRAALWVIGPGDDVRALALIYFYIGVWGAPPTLMMMSIKGWLLGMQDSRSPMVISIGVNVLNIAVSLLAVYGLKLGFAGIAVGTVTAQWAGLLYCWWLLRHKHRGLLSRMSWHTALRGGGLWSFFRVNGDIFARSTLMMVLNLFFMAVGARSGEMVLAVNALIMQLFTLFSYFMDGIAMAGEALVGKYWGMNRGKRLHSCVLRLFGWAAVLTVLCATLYAAVPGSIFGLLTSDSRVVAASVDYRWWCAAIPVAGVAAFVWDGVFIGLTRTRAMTLAVAVAVAAFFALYASLPRSMGNQALWFAFVTYLALRSLVQTAQYLWRRPGTRPLAD